MARLERLQVKGFKSIREMDLELRPLNVLIGPNGAGKSNLLSFFRMLDAIRQHRLQLFVGKEGGANAILHYGRKRTPELSARVSFATDEGSVAFEMVLAAAGANEMVFAHETLEHGGSGTAQVAKSGYQEALSFFPDPRIEEEQQIMAALVGLSYYHFHDTSPEAPIKQSCQVHDNRKLRYDGGNLAAFLYMLKQVHPAHYGQIRDTVRLAAPYFDDFVLEPSTLNSNMILLEWRERGSDMPFYAYQLSDGTLRFIALTTVLLQPELPGTILIDEPELGLHPSAINLLAGMMRAASQSAQVIVSTQSVTLLDALAEPEDVIVVDRKGGESTFRRLEPAKLDDWLEDYTLGELWQKNVLGGRP